jgi:nucleoside-diphosphate-sugar epimerase
MTTKKSMDKNLISVYGSTGFIGSRDCSLYSDKIVKIDREGRIPKSKNILYFISTVDNYNIHTNITIDVETNLKVLCEVLDFCRNTDIVFNFISSWFVYGETQLPAKEEYFCQPTGFYSITKKAAEDLLISFCKTYKVNYRILRLCNVYGHGDNKVSKKKNAIQYMINLLKEDMEVSLYDNGTPIRDLMHRDDVSNAIDLVVEGGELNTIYNIGSGHPTTVRDIIDIAKQILQSNSPITSIETPEFHSIVQVKDFWMDTSKLNSLGFKQKITLEQGIKELCLS